MANTKSAQKAVRKIERRTAVNKSRRSQMRTYVRKVEEALEAKDAPAAAQALKDAEPMVARAAQKGILHKARRIDRRHIIQGLFNLCLQITAETGFQIILIEQALF